MPSKDTDTTARKETAAVEKSESSERAPFDRNEKSDRIDFGTFEQILEMDDDDDREFSRAIVWGFMDQAQETFTAMRESIEKEDLERLSSLGHFLKGSSATLGLTTVKEYCEKIQHLGSGRDETGHADIDNPKVSLAGIKSALDEMKKEYAHVHRYFTGYYN
ncbi:histidine-phosphotransfer domain, HPT domain-containing protein, partial [Tuber magnatum]